MGFFPFAAVRACVEDVGTILLLFSSPGVPCPVAEDHNLTFSWLQRPSLSFSLLKPDGGTRAVRVEVGRELSGSVEKSRPPFTLFNPPLNFVGKASSRVRESLLHGKVHATMAANTAERTGRDFAQT